MKGPRILMRCLECGARFLIGVRALDPRCRKCRGVDVEPVDAFAPPAGG